MKTFATKSGKCLILFAVFLFMVLRVRAAGHSVIQGGTEGLTAIYNPPREYGVGGLPGTVVDVYSERGTLVTEVLTDSDGVYTIEDLTPGTYTLVASNDSTVFPYFGLNLTGSYETATQTISIRNKTTTVIDIPLILIFVSADS